MKAGACWVKLSVSMFIFKEILGIFLVINESSKKIFFCLIFFFRFLVARKNEKNGSGGNRSSSLPRPTF